MVNLVDNKLLASEDVQRLVYQITQLLPTEDSFFLSLLRSDLEIMRSEEGAVQAKLFPHLSLRSRRPQWTFIQTLSLSLPGFGEKLEVTGSNPKDRYQKIFLGENKTLHYEDSTGQIFHRDRQTLNDLCHKSVSDIGQWRLLNEIQFDLLMRNGWAEFLLNPLVEGEMVLVASGDDKKPSLKVIDPRTREDLSHSMPRGHRQYLKYFCVKDEF
jgi:hypothetical protein